MRKSHLYIQSRINLESKKWKNVEKIVIFKNNFWPLGHVLFGSNLVGAKGFLNSQDVYLGSDFGTSTPTYIILNFLKIFDII